MIGTVEIDDGKSKIESEMTTPGAIQVAELMAAMRDNGCRACPSKPQATPCTSSVSPA